MVRRNLLAVIIAATALLTSLAIAAIPVFTSFMTTHASNVTTNKATTSTVVNPTNLLATINGLAHISIVGSTQFIVDKTGHTASVDPNPYDVQIVPLTLKTPAYAQAGQLQAGDLVATNIGNQDKGNTLAVFPGRVGPGHQFNGSNPNFSGFAKEAFNTETGSDWVTNFSSNNVAIFSPNGALLTTVKSALFQKPWGIAYNGGRANAQVRSAGSFFVANAGNATIDRIDILATNGPLTFKVTQIAQLPTQGNETKISLIWAPTLQINGKQSTDVLLALDPAANRVAAFPNSTTSANFTNQGLTVFQGKPLNNPGGIALNPFNQDLLIVNLNDNNLLELNANTGRLMGIHLLDNVPVDLQTGNGSALFGVTASKDGAGNLVIYFTDDNTNTINRLGV